VVGLDNYPVLYEKLSERTPKVIGFNLPAFNLLDVIAIEVEHYSNKYPNDWELILERNLPLPNLGDTEITPYDPGEYDDDDWKWSVYATRNITQGLRVSAQVARDHLRTLDIYWRMEEREVLQERDHWYYVVNFAYGF